MRGKMAGTGALVAALALLPAAHGQEQQPAAEVGANGNAFTGGLSFTPADVVVPLGGVVRWRNTDSVVPHTATEDHALWDLGGDYGGTPANPSGFGPGATVERPFEAGTHHYYCRVHPAQMRGTVAVAPELTLKRARVQSRRPSRRGRRGRRGRRRKVLVVSVAVRWATAAPGEGLVFDVQRRRPGGEWIPFRAGTGESSGNFRRGKRAATWEVRARLRRADDPEAATDWSPLAQITG